MPEPSKSAVVAAVRAALQAALDAALDGARTARDEATHGESKAENKYDTRGLEASYLAAGQGARVVELRGALAGLVHPGSGVVGVGALVQLDDSAWYYVATGGGGVRVHADGVDVCVLTPDAPLGRALLGLGEGDAEAIGGREVVVTAVR
ncbi:MAG: transcription elongation factor GreAB [Alphaproteobacteria bacterium]|nr:transcription elongation factor GreAB [Alphaproteobacteria bacterium]